MYDIIESNSKTGLVQAVEKAIQEGFKPQGGAFTCNGSFFQAIMTSNKQIVSGPLGEVSISLINSSNDEATKPIEQVDEAPKTTIEDRSNDEDEANKSNNNNTSPKLTIGGSVKRPIRR